MRTLACIGALAALALAAEAAAQPAPPSFAPPVVKVEGLRPVSPHVQVIPDNSVPLVANIGYVIGAKAILVIDTGLGLPNGKAVAAVAQRLAPGKPIILVATHAHPEHDLGANAFPPGTRMIRSSAQQADKPSDMNVAQLFTARFPGAAELLKGAEFRDADKIFDDSHRVDLGGLTAELSALGPAHTDGDIGIWIPEDRVLFSGDVAMKAQPSINTPRATLASWRRALARLAALDPRVVVPSHGPVGDAGFIAGYRSYLDEVADRAAQAKASGASLEAATETVWQAMKDRYPDRGRLAGAVKMVLQPGP